MKHLCIVLAGMLLCGCASWQLHDVGRAVNALDTGQSASGLASLRYLSERGYVEADQALAGYYTGQSDQDLVVRAEPFFARLELQAQKTSRLYTRWLEKMARFDPDFVSQAYTRLQAQASLSEDNTIKLFRFERRYAKSLGKTFDTDTINAFVAEHGLQGAALIRVIDALEDPEAYYPQVSLACASASEETIYACHRIHLRQAKWHAPEKLESLVQGMVTDFERGGLTSEQFTSLVKMTLTARIGEPQVTLAYQLYSAANLEQPKLLLAIARYDIKEKRNFALPSLEKQLNALLDAGHAEAGLLLGTLYTYGKRTPRDPWKAEAYFTRALPLAEAEYRLGKLYLSGQLGQLQRQKAVDLLLSAARQGYRRAYSQLIDVFLGAPGVKPNPIYAHVFGQVAIALGVSLSASQQLALNTLDLNQAQYQQAQQLVTEELQANQSGGAVLARSGKSVERI